MKVARLGPIRGDGSDGAEEKFGFLQTRWCNALGPHQGCMMIGCFFRRACLVVALMYGATVTSWAEDGKVRRDGFDLYYRTEGSGAPVVLLSGGPGFDV